MKVILDLSDRDLKSLQKKADQTGRSRKKYMELVLTVHAAIKSEYTEPTLKNQRKKHH